MTEYNVKTKAIRNYIYVEGKLIGFVDDDGYSLKVYYPGSFQFSKSGDIWSTSFTFGPGGGFDVSTYQINTKTWSY